MYQIGLISCVDSYFPWPYNPAFNGHPVRLGNWRTFTLGLSLLMVGATLRAQNSISVAPGLVAVGSGDTLLSVIGTFSANSVVRWNGADLPTVFVSSSQLHATVPATDLAAPDLVPVTVFDPSSGESLPYNFPIFIVLSTNDLIYRSTDQKLYASLPGSLTNGNSIVSVDPQTGAVSSSIFVGSEPGRLAMSDDDQFLYIALQGSPQVRRFNLVNQTADIEFPLGSDSFFGPKFAGEIAVLPGSPHSVAVSTVYHGVSPAYAGLGIWDDSVERPNEVPRSINLLDSIAFGFTSANLYAYNNESTGFDFYRLSVSGAGVSFVDDHPNLISGFGNDIKFDNGFIYASNGAVVDPTIPILDGTFTISGSFDAFVPDSSINRAFYAADNGNGQTLYSFDQTTFTQQGHIDIGGVSGADSMLRWGTDGIAFRDIGFNGIVAFHSGFVRPPPQPVIASVVPNPIPVASDSFTIQVNGSNFVPGSLARWNGSNRTTVYVNSGQLSVTLLPSDHAIAGSGQLTVYNPPAQGSLSAALAVPVQGTFPATDLGVTIDHHLSPDPVQFGAMLRFNVNITNSGGIAPVVTLSLDFSEPVQLAPGSTPVSALQVPFGDLSDGASVLYTLALSAPLGHDFTVTATVASEAPDANPQNNTASSTAQVRLRPFLPH